MTRPALQDVVDRLRDRWDFTVEQQGTGLVFRPRGSSCRSAYLNEALVRDLLLHGGIVAATAFAHEALGLEPTGDVPAGHPASIGPGAHQRVVPVPGTTPALQDLAAAITASSSALAVLLHEGCLGTDDRHKATGCVLALLERAKQVACGK